MKSITFYLREFDMSAKITFLGTSFCLGVPVVGCKCDVCVSKNKKNKRLRPSILLELEGKKILVDVAPDFREQALKHQINDIDALFLTHAHYDHVAGFDDLRVFFYLNDKKIPCILSEDTLKSLKKTFHYLFKGKSNQTVDDIRMDMKVLENDFGDFDLFNKKFRYFSYFQENAKVNGFKINNFAYVTDIKKYTDELVDELMDIDTLVISAPLEEPTNSHFGFEDVLSFSREVKAKKTIITHISHFIDHEKVMKKLPKDFSIAYDSMEIIL